MIGDGESAEGSVWEALHFASNYKLDNLCVIFDINRLGQSDPTSLQHNMEVYRKRLESFGFNALVVDGHDVDELAKVKILFVLKVNLQYKNFPYICILLIFQAFHEAQNTEDRPTAVLAKTYKGKNFPNIEDLVNWHGKPLGEKSSEVIAV